jgi:hypothetical protein
MLSDSESNRKIIAENLGGVTVTPRRLELRIISGTSLASKFKSYARSVQLEYFSGPLSNNKNPKFPCHFLWLFSFTFFRNAYPDNWYRKFTILLGFLVHYSYNIKSVMSNTLFPIAMKKIEFTQQNSLAQKCASLFFFSNILKVMCTAGHRTVSHRLYTVHVLFDYSRSLCILIRPVGSSQYTVYSRPSKVMWIYSYCSIAEETSDAVGEYTFF